MLFTKNYLIYFTLLSLLQITSKTDVKEIEIIINTEVKNKTYVKELNNDSILYSRTVEIVKNEISDTILFGYSILEPGYTGEIYYNKLEDRTDAIADYRYSNSGTERIDIHTYNNKISTGKLTLRLKRYGED